MWTRRVRTSQKEGTMYHKKNQRIIIIIIAIILILAMVLPLVTSLLS